MAFSVNGSSGVGRRRSRTGGSLAEINIVPLVDVVLVLLIIFMLTAHVMEFGMEVNVPEVKNTQDSAEELPVVSISRAGNLYLNEKPVNINNVADEISTKFKGQKAVYLRADKATPFDPIAQVMDALNKKFQIRVVVKPEDTSARR
ncbi:MAG: biopolymer transporter ExbD [Bryobacteraceae bacterium]